MERKLHPKHTAKMCKWCPDKDPGLSLDDAPVIKVTPPLRTNDTKVTSIIDRAARKAKNETSLF